MLPFLATFLISAESSWGFNEPTVLNLGATSFFDGMVFLTGTNASYGFYFNQYAQWYSANRFNDDRGNAIPGAPKLDAYISLTQLLYLLDKPSILGGHFGVDVVLPVVSLNPSPANTPFNANGGVLGNLILGPAIQFDPIMYGTNPFFMQRLEFDVIVPTGNYSHQFALNPGNNALALNPYWAGTLFLGSDVVVSWRLHYLWNGVNREPDPLFYPPGARVQAGQAVHFNFDVAYNLYAQRIYGGVNSYFLKQFTEDKINGVSAAGTEERVLGIGPGAAFVINKNMLFCLNLYFETDVANRTSGTRLNGLFTWHF